MLAIINPYGWNADQSGSSSVPSDVKTRTFNFLASLHSLATCAAGGTPTAVNPVNSGTNVKDATSNCIKVLSNTEAGGWTVGSSNNITAATAYSASAGSLLVDLYRDSGKTTYPWYRYTVGTNTYPFNSSFTSYPQLEMWMGSAGGNTMNPATTGWSSDSNFYYGSTSFTRTGGNWTSSPTQQPLNIGNGAGAEVYVAITANYIIVSIVNQIVYYGIRNQAGWELGRQDNPAWATFGISGEAGSANHANSNSSHTEWQWAYMAGIDSSGSVSGAGRRGNDRTYATGSNVISGSAYSAYNNQFNDSNMGYLRPLFPMAYPSNGSVGYGWAPEAPITDPVTGLTVPPAYPIVYNFGNGGISCSGQIPGIFKGMAQNGTGLNFYVTAAEYVIDGQAYVPIRSVNSSYPELFFLRKA
jgi:hypothetical protein